MLINYIACGFIWAIVSVGVNRNQHPEASFVKNAVCFILNFVFWPYKVLKTAHMLIFTEPEPYEVENDLR